jgi:hypothetical protein
MRGISLFRTFARRTVSGAFLALTFALVATAGSTLAATASFGNGTFRVGQDISAGTYRTRSAPSSCYWERLKGFSGDLDDIIANDFSSGFQVVTIKGTDKGFKSSRCGKWSSNLSRVTSSYTSFGQGTFIVGTDMAPGTYRSGQSSDCYWARLRGFGGTLNEIITNDFRSGSGRSVVTIRSGDKGFTSSRCGTWTKS